MKVTIIRYEKLVNLGNYENQKLGVEVQLEDGEAPHDAVKRAVAFVEACLTPRTNSGDIERAERVVDNPDEYSPKRVREAQEVLKQARQEADIPF